MATRRSDSGVFQSGWAAANHERFFWFLGFLERALAPCPLAPNRGIVYTLNAPPLTDTLPTEIGGNAGADIVSLAFFSFFCPIGVGKELACKTDGIGIARFEQRLGHVRGGDAPDRQHRLVGDFANLSSITSFPTPFEFHRRMNEGMMYAR